MHSGTAGGASPEGLLPLDPLRPWKQKESMKNFCRGKNVGKTPRDLQAALASWDPSFQIWAEEGLGVASCLPWSWPLRLWAPGAPLRRLLAK